MTIVAIGSAKGGPGVTTSALALAVTWPAPAPVTLLEADPSGGDLAAWLDLPSQPGLVSLAAAGRRTIDPALFGEHLQAVPGSERVSVLCGPVAADQAQAALSSLRERLLEAARLRAGVVILDCGRLDPASPALRLFESADIQVVACRPGLAAVHHLQARLRTLGARGPRLLALGERPYAPDEIALACGVELLGAVADDPRAAATLADGPALSDRALARSSLIRSARTIAEALAGPPPVAGHLVRPPAATAAPAPPPPPAAAPPIPPPPPPGGHPGPSVIPPPPGAPVER